MPKYDSLLTLDAHNDSIILCDVRGDAMDSRKHDGTELRAVFDGRSAYSCPMEERCHE